MGDPTTPGPCPTKKKKIRSERKMVYKYPRAQKFFDSPLSTHFGEEVHELLVIDVEFPGLEMVKIKAFLSFDNLLAMLEERHLSNWTFPRPLSGI